MSDKYEDDDDDYTPPPRGPRTMRSRPEPEPEDDEPRQVNSAPETDDDGDDEAAAPRSAADMIRGGWTEGQRTMDSASDYAQAFKPDSDTVIIKFIEDVPYANYRRHWIDRMTPQGPKKRPYVCLETVGKTCPLCGTGDRPQAVSSFNILVVGDDGQVILKSWDVGVRLFGSLKNYNNDPKMGPLTKHFYAVSKTGKGSSTVHNINVVRARDLEEDFGIPVPSEEDMQRAGRYDASIIQIPKRSELEEVAQEIAEWD